MRSKGQEALNNLDLRAGGERGSGAKSWLEHIADSPVVVVYRFTTGGIPADAR